ncbi:hypothetical protein MMC20_008150, partial [Loxospora ochrophaea]|nr:hypothetical protein [Loxospora ochrophaea]
MALDTCSSVAQPNTDSQASQQDPPQKRLPPLSSNFYQNRQVRASLRSKQSLSYSQEQAAKAGYSRKDIPTKRLFDLDPEYPKVRASLGSKQSLFNSQEQAPKADHSRKASLHCHEASIEDEPSPVVKSSAEQAKQKILMDLDDSDRYPNVEPPMVRQPETRPISHEQLVVEVKGIYAGLTMVEAKCIDVDEKQSKAAQEKESARQT